MTWHDDGVSLTLDVSTSGTYINPPYRTNYPFTASGGVNNPPDNWFRYLPTGSASSDLAVSTSGEVCNIGSSPTNAIPYLSLGIERGFNVTPGHTYRIECKIKAISTRQSTTRPFLSCRFDYNGTNAFSRGSDPFPDGMPDAENWYTMSVDQKAEHPTNGVGSNFVSVTIHARCPTFAPNTADWGIQITDFAITDVTVTASPVFTWHSIECDTLEATIKYGRARFTERYDVGTFNISLNNVSGDYIYQDPHPWGLRPGRMFRMRAHYKGTTYPLAFGVLDRVATYLNVDGTSKVLFTVFDTTSFTSDTTTPNISFMSPSTINDPDSLSGNRVASILNFAGIAQSLRRIDPGIFGMQNVMESNRGLREEIGVTADSEGGSFFAERDGTIIYRDRSWSSRDPKGGIVQANFTAYPGDLVIDNEADGVPTDPNAPDICPNTMDTDWSLERVINTITLATVGSTKQYFNNVPSQQEYGIRTYQRLDFVNWGGGVQVGGTTKVQLQARANDIFSTSLDALLRVKRLSFRPKEGVWEWALTFFLDWLIRVLYYNPTGEWGFRTVVRVQSIEHRITPKEWLIALDVDQPISYSGDIKPLPPGGWDVGLWDINLWDEQSGEFVPSAGAYWNSGQLWNGPGVTWLGRGWSSGLSKWSDPDNDWKP